MSAKMTEDDLLNKIRLLDNENRALIKQQESTRSFLNALTDTIILIRPDGTIIDSNQAILDQFEVTREKFVGSCIWDYYPPGIAQFRKSRVERVLQAGQAIRFEDEQEGTWYDTIISPLFEGAKDVARIAIISHDITGHK